MPPTTLFQDEVLAIAVRPGARNLLAVRADTDPTAALPDNMYPDAVHVEVAPTSAKRGRTNKSAAPPRRRSQLSVSVSTN